MKPLLSNHSLLSIISILLLSFPIAAQNNTISLLWEEDQGVQSGVFGIPAEVDESENFYRAGMEAQSQGGTDVILQKWSSEGVLQWDVALNTSSADKYEPTQLTVDNSNVYITGIVTYAANGETDIFISKTDLTGDVLWFHVDNVSGNDVSADIFVDGNSEQVFLCGTTDRENTYDLLLTAYDLEGSHQWSTTRDYSGNVDLGAKLNMDGSNIVVNGSSQSSSVEWDIVSWHYSTSGSFVSEERTNGLNASSDELSDGALIMVL